LKIALARANIPIHIVYTRSVHSNYQDRHFTYNLRYEGWNFNSGNYLFTTDAK